MEPYKPRPAPYGIDGAKPGPLMFKWMCRVRERQGGRKELTYYANGGGFHNPQEFGDFVTSYYPNVEVLTVGLCTGNPEKVLFPVPADHFENLAVNEALLRDYGKIPKSLEDIEPLRSIVRPLERVARPASLRRKTSF